MSNPKTDDHPACPEPGIQDRVFINHIQRHLLPDQEVVCKICGLTAKEIIRQESPVAECQDAVSRDEAIHELETIPIGTEEGPELIARRAVRIVKDLPPVLPIAERQDAVSRSSLIAIISCLRRSSANDYWCGWNMALKAMGGELAKLPPVLPASFIPQPHEPKGTLNREGTNERRADLKK